MHTEDIFVIVSNSGINGVVAEMALLVKERGHRLIAVTSLDHSLKSEPRHASGKRLCEIADVVLDNGAPIGDVLLPHQTGGVSSITAAVLAQMVVTEVVRRIEEAGQTPPIYLSANIAGVQCVLPDCRRREVAATTGFHRRHRRTRAAWRRTAQNEVLTPAQVSSRVNGFRAAGVTHTDTVGTGGGTCPTSPPTSSPPSSPSPSASPSPSTPPTGGTGCVNAPNWNISTAYLGGAQVKHRNSANGVPGGPALGDGVHLWRARWWTQGSEPGWTAQWEDLGRC